MLNHFLNICTFNYFISITVLPLVIVFCSSKRNSEKQNKNDGNKNSKNLDEESDGEHVGKLAEDDLANVHLLTPTLTGGCTDDNAAKEAKNRHMTNQYFPKLEIQSTRIVDGTTSDELKKILEKHPPHPPQRFRKNIINNGEKWKKREEEFKNLHVSWHNVGLVFLIRGHDPARAKDDNGTDTIDSKSSIESNLIEGHCSDKINSEIPMTPAKDASKKVKEVKKVTRKDKKTITTPTQPTQCSEEENASNCGTKNESDHRKEKMTDKNS